MVRNIFIGDELTKNSIQGRLRNWLLFVTNPNLFLKEYYHLSNVIAKCQVETLDTFIILLQSVHVHNFGRGEVLVTLTYLTP